MLTVIPQASISPQKIVLYDYLEGCRRGGSTSEASRNNLKNNSTGGKISKSAAGRISAAVNWLYALSDTKTKHINSLSRDVRYRLNFVTLTLPAEQMHSDLVIKRRALNPLLERLRRHHGMKSYIWKAEPQKNGNIHFHITTNVFIHYADLRKYWIELLQPLGYISAYYAKGHEVEPPCTEVKAVYKVRKLAAYLAKYLTKESDIRAIEGRQWFLSTNLSKLRPAQVVRDTALSYEIEKFQNEKGAAYMVGEFATVIFADIFSSNLSKYPTLLDTRNSLLSLHKSSVN